MCGQALVKVLVMIGHDCTWIRSFYSSPHCVISHDWRISIVVAASHVEKPVLISPWHAWMEKL